MNQSIAYTLLRMSQELYAFCITEAVPQYNALFGEGNGPIVLHDVRCTGLESRLFNCEHGGFEANTCAHSRDAGVVCIEGKSWNVGLL